MSETTIPVIEPTRTRKTRVVKRTKRTRTAHSTRSAGVRDAEDHDPNARVTLARTDEPAEEPLRRLSREERDVDKFALPARRKKPGWDYEWKTFMVINQPVEAAQMREVFDGGWRPEKAKDWPEMVMPGTPPDAAVEQYGQRLYGRPMQFTMQARKEDKDFADRQMRDRLVGAQQGRLDGGSGLADMGNVVQPVPLGVSLEAEVGSYAPRR